MSNYQVMPPLTDEEYAELKAKIKEYGGVEVPVVYDEFENIIDGHHRVKACMELGITEWPKTYCPPGMTDEEKRAYARMLNMARRQLSPKQKREIIRQQLLETPEKSNRQIAEALGVSDHTVGSVRKDMESTAQIAQLKKTIGADGKTRPRKASEKTETLTESRKTPRCSAETLGWPVSNANYYLKIANLPDCIFTIIRDSVKATEENMVKADIHHGESKSLDDLWSVRWFRHICALPRDDLKTTAMSVLKYFSAERFGQVQNCTWWTYGEFHIG